MSGGIAAGHERHPAHVQHHFDTAEQQFEAGKLGMWLFLATEVLLFGGLFCAYAIYRASHPEMFHFAHRFLDWRLGGLNTLILITSSFTMAWAVRESQLGRRRLAALLLGITLACGAGFMGIKYIEYKAKFEHHLLWGRNFHPDPEYVQAHAAEHGAAEPARAAPFVSARPQGPPPNMHIFFGLYFLMTGLHGLHVLFGMLAIGWVLRRTLRGDFSPAYFTPVDLVGLYWHLVDLIWIFLFPLLYLIK
ncbi:MAG: cytochrome c oxidase subunit 3 family protein [Deltaproteobacteria bacterium]|nr:MAG: cytochrome c oxidase subunit 3 family protein [Deltaproteobacteria bacterium]